MLRVGFTPIHLDKTKSYKGLVLSEIDEIKKFGNELLEKVTEKAGREVEREE